jgi:hypothetical protein
MQPKEQEAVVTYTVKARNSPDVWVFQYHLNGTLRSFTVLDGRLSPKQTAWLFSQGNFPYEEEHMGQWRAKLKKNFSIEQGLLDTSFAAFWNAYAHKVHKIEAERAWNKLKEADRIKALEGTRRYNDHLRRNTWKNKMDAKRFLKEKIWEDEFDQ